MQFARLSCPAIVVLCTQAVSAAPLLWTLNYARVGPAGAPQQTICTNVNGPACSGSVQLLETNWSIDYHSNSAAEFGMLRAESSVQLEGDASNGSPNAFTSVGGNANYRDVITVLGGIDSGVQVLTFQVSGTSSQTPGQSGRAQFQRNLYTNGVESTADYLPNSQQLVAIPIPFVFGEPTEYQIRFYALSQLFQYLPGASATADFFTTARLIDIDVIDAGGQHVPTFSIHSASGTDYVALAASNAVPEPGTFIMATLAFAWLAIRRGSVGHS
jgi:hypothetical protein